jgi:GNAT superfamily N-acetyltransferase
MDDVIEIRAVNGEDVRPIRRRVLRAGLPRPNVEFEGDDAVDTLHVGAFVDGRLAAVATVLRRPPPDDPSATAAWQVRGMATEPASRGRGLGGSLLERCIEHVRERGGDPVWCNARIRAVPFYERHGFARVGGVFDVVDLGPHVRMHRVLTSGRTSAPVERR